MTETTMNLETMLGKTSDADLLRRMLEEGLQRLMELEAKARQALLTARRVLSA